MPGSLPVAADALEDGQDTRSGTHRAEEGDLAEYSLEQSVAANKDQQHGQYILQMAQAQDCGTK